MARRHSCVRTFSVGGSLHAIHAQARRRGLTRIDVAAVVAMLLLLLLVGSGLYWTLRPRAISGRELSPRIVCAANLKGIGTGLYTYSTENKDVFPIAPHLAATEAGRTSVEYAPHAIGANNERESNDTDLKVSTTRNFWVLVRDGASAPGSFICPVTADMKADIDDPLKCWDFGTTFDDCGTDDRTANSQVSYGYQVPYGTTGHPSADRHQRMVLAADRGPYSRALEIGVPNPGVPDLTANADPANWSPWNSPNHGGEGQNVLYADSHADFQQTPIVGVDDDNIYTRWATADDTAITNRIHGTPPTGTEAPYSQTDSLIYP